MKKNVIFFAAAILSLATAVAHAETLKGSTVHGTLTFPGSSTNDFLIDDPVKIGAGQEFVFDSGIATYTANFNPTGLTIRVNCDGKASTCKKDPAFEMTFNDPLFAGATFVLDSNDLGITDSLDSSGMVKAKRLTVDFAGGSTGGNETAIFSITPPTPAPSAATPEPGSLVLVGTGLLGFAGTLRRRFHA